MKTACGQWKGLRGWFSVRRLASLAMLIAVQVLLSRFLSLQLGTVKYGLGFVPVMLAGAMYGAMGGAVVGALSDLVGALLFPFGTYFVGYTLTAALSGAVYGWILSKNHRPIDIILAYAITAISVTVVLNTLCLALQRSYQPALPLADNISNMSAYMFARMPDRLVQAGVMLCLQVYVTNELLNAARLDARIINLHA